MCTFLFSKTQFSLAIEELISSDKNSSNKFDLVTKILSHEKFCQAKTLCDEILSHLTWTWLCIAGTSYLRITNAAKPTISRRDAKSFFLLDSSTTSLTTQTPTTKWSPCSVHYEKKLFFTQWSSKTLLHHSYFFKFYFTRA